MPDTITFRLDDEIRAALAELNDPGLDQSTTIRNAIRTAAEVRRGERLREQALRLARDPVDLAEIAAIRADMDGEPHVDAGVR